MAEIIVERGYDVEKEKYRLESIKELLRNKEKSEESFDKNLLYITSGTLILSLTFIEKIVPLPKAHYAWFLITSWILLTGSLLINLISHQLSADFTLKQLYSLNNFESDEVINNKIIKDNKMVMRLNYITIGLMISGIVALVVYCSINVLI